MKIKNRTFYVSVVDFAFIPNEITVIPGDTVYFELGWNNEKEKQITGSIESPPLKAGSVWQWKFEKVGKNKISCAEYPNMTCLINVVEYDKISDPYRKMMYEML